MTQPTPRQTEIAQIAQRLRANAHGPGDMTRFRELVQAEAQPAIDAALQRAMPQLVARARTVQAIRNERQRIVRDVSRDVMARYRRGEFNRKR